MLSGTSTRKKQKQKKMKRKKKNRKERAFGVHLSPQKRRNKSVLEAAPRCLRGQERGRSLSQDKCLLDVSALRTPHPFPRLISISLPLPYPHALIARPPSPFPPSPPFPTYSPLSLASPFPFSTPFFPSIPFLPFPSLPLPLSHLTPSLPSSLRCPSH